MCFWGKHLPYPNLPGKRGGKWASHHQDSVLMNWNSTDKAVIRAWQNITAANRGDQEG
jgi:hypothetical protein